MAEKTSDLSTWITDTEISTRFPYYTRANADEVGPEPFSPLGWSLGWAKGCSTWPAERASQHDWPWSSPLYATLQLALGVDLKQLP